MLAVDIVSCNPVACHINLANDDRLVYMTYAVSPDAGAVSYLHKTTTTSAALAAGVDAGTNVSKTTRSAYAASQAMAVVMTASKMTSSHYTFKTAAQSSSGINKITSSDYNPQPGAHMASGLARYRGVDYHAKAQVTAATTGLARYRSVNYSVQTAAQPLTPVWILTPHATVGIIGCDPLGITCLGSVGVTRARFFNAVTGASAGATSNLIRLTYHSYTLNASVATASLSHKIVSTSSHVVSQIEPVNYVHALRYTTTYHTSGGATVSSQGNRLGGVQSTVTAGGITAADLTKITSSDYNLQPRAAVFSWSTKTTSLAYTAQPVARVKTLDILLHRVDGGGSTAAITLSSADGVALNMAPGVDLSGQQGVDLLPAGAVTLPAIEQIKLRKGQ